LTNKLAKTRGIIQHTNMFKRFISKFKRSSSKIPVPERPPLLDDLDLSLTAYDLVLDPSAASSHPAVAGWCFGLPPGISPEQWPLDPRSGYPLQHGFTLRLPDAFKVHGPDIVAISFFGTAPEHVAEIPDDTVDGLFEIIHSPDTSGPRDPQLRAFWEHARKAHPLLHRIEAYSGGDFAIIPLTAEEFKGPACAVPSIARSQILSETNKPNWMSIGGAASYLEIYARGYELEKLSKTFMYHGIGGLPENRVDYSVPIVMTPRQNDPNCGKAVGDSDYVKPFSNDYEPPDWLKGLGANHLGGTMLPYQAVPQFSAYYLEFTEYFGNFNFGTGNAQLDLKTFAIDWAC